jgi:hypothetical protein
MRNYAASDLPRKKGKSCVFYTTRNKEKEKKSGT